MSTQGSSFGLNRRYSSIAAILLVLIWLWVALDRPYSLPTHIYWNIYSNGPLSSQPLDAFELPPVESDAIRSICAETTWNDGLVFTCDEAVGGIGSVRNSMLNCVRYAIAAGAALVLPKCDLRDPADVFHVRTGDKKKLDYMFDVQHFVNSMSLSCPGLRLFDSVIEVDDYSFAHKPVPLSPESLVDNIPSTGLPAPENWRASFDTWLETYGTRVGVEPVIVALSRSYIQYPIYSDGEDFAMIFGTVLQFPQEIRILATKILVAISKAFDLPIDLNKLIVPNSFLGCHLSTDKDPTEVGPRSTSPDTSAARYETQLQNYLAQAPRNNPAFIYLASGDAAEIGRFKSDAAKVHLNVTTKHDLFASSPEDTEALARLTWDQQAMVDFLVLLRGSDFGGVAHSAFAWNVALKRHQNSHIMDYLDGGQGLSDEFSKIYGISRASPEFASYNLTALERFQAIQAAYETIISSGQFSDSGNVGNLDDSNANLDVEENAIKPYECFPGCGCANTIPIPKAKRHAKLFFQALAQDCKAANPHSNAPKSKRERLRVEGMKLLIAEKEVAETGYTNTALVAFADVQQWRADLERRLRDLKPLKPRLSGGLEEGGEVSNEEYEHFAWEQWRQERIEEQFVIPAKFNVHTAMEKPLAVSWNVRDGNTKSDPKSCGSAIKRERKRAAKLLKISRAGSGSGADHFLKTSHLNADGKYADNERQIKLQADKWTKAAMEHYGEKEDGSWALLCLKVGNQHGIEEIKQMPLESIRWSACPVDRPSEDYHKLRI